MDIIKIKILENNPNGIVEIKIANRSGKAVIVPRGKLQDFLGMEGNNSPAIYFLFGANDFDDKFAYIGQTENFQRRLNQQDTNRDDWNIAFGFFVGDNDINIRYLEGICVKLARDINRYQIKNDQTPPDINLDNFNRPINKEFLKEISIVLSLFQYPIFQKLPKKEDTEDIYYFKIGDANASGVLLEDNKFMVFKGSTARIENTPGFFLSGRNLKRLLIEEEVLIKKDNQYCFSRDYVFNSPSGAGGVIAGSNSNGWKDWKNKENKTLDEVKRID